MYIKQQYSGYDLLFLKLSYENKISGKKKNTLQTLGTKLYTSLEWCLNSPPKPHGFASFPLQSGKKIKKHLGNILIVLSKVILISYLELQQQINP